MGMSESGEMLKGAYSHPLHLIDYKGIVMFSTSSMAAALVVTIFFFFFFICEWEICPLVFINVNL